MPVRGYFIRAKVFMYLMLAVGLGYLLHYLYTVYF